MTVLVFGLMPVYAHNQDWNDGFKFGAVDDTCPNNGYNDSQCDQFNDGYDPGFNSTCIGSTYEFYVGMT